MKTRVVVNRKKSMMRESELVFIFVNLRVFFFLLWYQNVLIFLGMVRDDVLFLFLAFLLPTPLRVLFHFRYAFRLDSLACVLFLVYLNYFIFSPSGYAANVNLRWFFFGWNWYGKMVSLSTHAHSDCTVLAYHHYSGWALFAERASLW